MITKAYIEALPKPGDNIFIVRIPLFESAGIGHTLNRLNTSNYEATLCYQPGNMKGYAVGDCVYVAFEHDECSEPVIIGKLYVNDSTSEPSFACPEQLNVSDKTTLSKNTYIDDLNVYELLNKVKVLLDNQT